MLRLQIQIDPPDILVLDIDTPCGIPGIAHRDADPSSDFSQVRSARARKLAVDKFRRISHYLRKPSEINMGAGFTERELDIMAVLWARGPSTAAEVRAELEDDVTHNTVQKMLSILEDKGYVTHVEEGRTHRFHALVQREEAGTSAFERLIDKMFVGSAEALLTHFVRDRRLSRADLERVRAVLDERLEQSASPRPRRSAQRVPKGRHDA